MQDMHQLKIIDIREIEKDDLVDIKEIKIDMNKPFHERIIRFIEEVKNPYCFKVGDVAVKVEFEDKNTTFEERFQNLLVNQELMWK